MQAANSVQVLATPTATPFQRIGAVPAVSSGERSPETRLQRFHRSPADPAITFAKVRVGTCNRCRCIQSRLQGDDCRIGRSSDPLPRAGPLIPPGPHPSRCGGRTRHPPGPALGPVSERGRFECSRILLIARVRSVPSPCNTEKRCKTTTTNDKRLRWSEQLSTL
jgi:hypothetical protein